MTRGEVVNVRSISETDIYLWAALSQDASPMHLDEAFAKTTPAGTRIAHGNYVLTLLAEAAAALDADVGRSEDGLRFSKVRFVRPVHVGDRLALRVEPPSGSAPQPMEAVNQDGTVVLAAVRIPAVPPDDVEERDPLANAATLGRTVSNADVALYRFTTGDKDALDDLRADAQDRIAVPAPLLSGLMSATSSRWCLENDRADAYSYGYDDLWLAGSLWSGDTVRVAYANQGARPERHQLLSLVEARTPGGTLVARGRHILWHRRDTPT